MKILILFGMRMTKPWTVNMVTINNAATIQRYERLKTPSDIARYMPAVMVVAAREGNMKKVDGVSLLATSTLPAMSSDLSTRPSIRAMKRSKPVHITADMTCV